MQKIKTGFVINSLIVFKHFRKCLYVTIFTVAIVFSCNKCTKCSTSIKGLRQESPSGR